VLLLKEKYRARQCGNSGANSVWATGFRPVVCLESSTQLEKKADGVYEIVTK